MRLGLGSILITIFVPKGSKARYNLQLSQTLASMHQPENGLSSHCPLMSTTNRVMNNTMTFPEVNF